tara:strand:+ start:10194 stop:10742 length:549 start_codon:yes stop_codon:yes gene_type:complete
MTGHKISKELLNNTLKIILELLTEYNITNWFVGYGTLLGIVRENSCIDNDDDIDIIIDKNQFDSLEKALLSNGFILSNNINDRRGYNNKTFLKITRHLTKKISNIDFYLATLDNEGNFNDTWENVIWSKCYVDNNKNLIEYDWNGLKLYLPNNYQLKLQNRYGDDWKIPQMSKGVKPRKKIL